MATTDIQFGQSTITYPTSGLVAQPVKYSVDSNGNVTGLVGPAGAEIPIGGISCEAFGASASATAADNTAAIQAALNTKGRVSLTTPGVYNITSSGLGTEILKIPSDTVFYIGSGVTIRGPATGTAVVPLITNSNWRSNKNSVTSITCSTSSAPYVTTATATTSGSHGYAVGDYVLIKGDTTGYYNGIWKVVSATSNTFAFYMFGFPSAPTNAAGTVIAYAANANFKIIGEGVFDGNLNTTASGDLGELGKFGSIFNKIGDAEVSCGFINTAKYGIQFCNAYRATFNPGTFATPSDGIHGNGPISNVRINGYYGFTGDDGIALTANNTNYTYYALQDADGTQNSDGDIVDVDIDNPQVSTGGSRLFLVQTGNGLKVKRLTIRGAKRSSSLSGLYGLLDIQGAETGAFEDVLIDGIYGNMPANTAILQIGTGTGTININNLTIKNIGSHGGDVDGTPTALTAPILNGTNTAVNITGLTIDGVNVDVDLTNASGNIKLLNLGAGSGVFTANKVKLKNFTVIGSGNTRSVSMCGMMGNAQFDSVEISDCHIAANNSNLFELVSSQSGTGTVQISNCYQNGDGTNNGQALVTIAGSKSLDVFISNTKGNAALNGGVYVYGGSAKTYNIYLSNVNVSHKLIVNAGTSHTFNVWAHGCSCVNFTQSSGNMIAVGTTSTWNFNGACADIGIDLANIARKDGTIIYNTNSALGTLGAAGLVVGQGTAANSWHLLADPTKVY